MHDFYSFIKISHDTSVSRIKFSHMCEAPRLVLQNKENFFKKSSFLPKFKTIEKFITFLY